jgi:TRAP-type C4-dicarboxylate transport system permease small subunit
MDRILERISTVSVLLSGFVIVVMMMMITADAVGRKLGYPIPGGLEYSEALMVPLTYLALMAVQRHRENVFVGLTTSRLSPRVQTRLDALAAAMAFVLFAVFTWAAYRKALDSTQMGEFWVAAMEIPVWPFRWFVPFGLTLLCIQLAATVVRDLKNSAPSRADYIPDL